MALGTYLLLNVLNLLLRADAYKKPCTAGYRICPIVNLRNIKREMSYTVTEDVVMVSEEKPLKVCLIGSGNFACAVSRILGQNVKANKDKFQEEVRMWTFQEQVDDGSGRFEGDDHERNK